MDVERTIPTAREALRPAAERLLNAAEELFLSRGMEASVRDITGAAGASSAAIHYYFGSRDGLVAAVIERRWEDLAKRRREALSALQQSDSRPTVRQTITALVATFVEFVDEGGDEAQRWLDLMTTLWVERSPALALMAPHFTEFAWQELLQQALGNELDQVECEARLTFAVELILMAVGTPTPTLGLPTYPLPTDLGMRAKLVIDAVVGLLESPSGTY